MSERLSSPPLVSPQPWPAANRDGLAELRRLLDEHDEVYIFGHKDADGDTLGCSLAFAEALRRQAKRAHVVIPPPHPDLYEWLPGFSEMRAEAPPDADIGLCIFFDAGNMERSGKTTARITERTVIVNIDHHASNSRFGTLNLVDPDASAVGQMCLQLLHELGWEITPTMATCLYAAILTDTGGFRHENTSVQTLADGARLAALGADPSDIAGRIYKSRPATTVRLNALSLSSMQIEMEGQLAWARVTRRMLHQTGAVMAEAEGIIDSLNSIGGLQAAIIFKEVGARLTKISVRTRNGVDAAALCARFGGGGHTRAAGAELLVPMRDAVQAVLQAAHEVIDGAGRRSQYR
ncbi:MAG: bifunctional oligoribonuclease/PAP phosphatase NrnA [Candidatus Dormiibacterota bacterium]